GVGWSACAHCSRGSRAAGLISRAAAACRSRRRRGDGVTSTTIAPPSRGLSLRLAWRELRGGVRGFGVFIACIALGVFAIAGVGSSAQALVDGLAREGRAILGGDLSFNLIQREATPAERAFLDGQGRIS